MKHLQFLPCILAGVLLPGIGYGLPPLQLFVELTPAGGVLRPAPGSYSGPVVIDRPLTLDGAGAVTIDGGGSGTVLSIKADGTVVRGLRLTNSGDRHDSVDAGLLLEADGALIANNVIALYFYGEKGGHVIHGNRFEQNFVDVAVSAPMSARANQWRGNLWDNYIRLRPQP